MVGKAGKGKIHNENADMHIEIYSELDKHKFRLRQTDQH